MLNTGSCGMRLRSWLSLKTISKAFLRPSVQKYSISKVSAKKPPNRYMHTIYPTEESMKALTVFQIYEGTGEWFDLSKKPIERASFAFGCEEAEQARKKPEGYNGHLRKSQV